MGYIYIMIDSTPRADGRSLVKIGMTGSTQTPQDRLVSLRTGNPNLMLGMSVMVAQPRKTEQRVHEGLGDLADRLSLQGSREFFLLKEGVTQFDVTERVLKTTFAHRLNVRDLVALAR